MVTYDDIVVGAGSAGAIVTTRLGEDPDVEVVLIEAEHFNRLSLLWNGQDGVGMSHASTLRIRDMGGPRAADVSVMPAIVSENTNAADMMIAKSAADLRTNEPTRTRGPRSMETTFKA